MSDRDDGPLCCARAVHDFRSGWSCPVHGEGASVPVGDGGAGHGEPCAGCGREHSAERPVAWSPAFGEWLCTGCRASRTDEALGETDRANLVARRGAGAA
jgi:hypothetical protein